MIRCPDRLEAQRLRGVEHRPPALPGEPLLDFDEEAQFHSRATVTAPSAADVTDATYLANTPSVYLGAGARHSFSRRWTSSAGNCRSSRRLGMLMEIVSPSRTAAIGPPTAASGATWPTMKPRVAPLKRPSVSSATDSPSPSPTIAAVTPSISRMPGPPRGPTYRMTTTSPGWILRAVTAAMAAS